MHWTSFGSGGERPKGTGVPRGAASSSAPASKDKKDKEDVLENFDPEKLERGATALKELDSDRSLGLKAFELTTIQENTRQLEIMLETEKTFTQRTEAENSSSGLMNEEARRTISHSADEERNWFSKEKPQILDKIVLQPELRERLQWSTNALLRAKEHGTPYRNLMLYGPPGTGKTLFARTLARESGLDYAVMSGGDLGPLGRNAVQELHKMFKWANSSKKGLILFIDEADSFLRKGRQSSTGMSEDMRNALSAFLHHTGTESDKFTVILATNVPSIVDGAVLDRMDEAFEFSLPGQEQRVQILKMLFDRHINAPTKQGIHIEVDSALDDKWLEEVARRTERFSGRQLSKLVLAYQAAVFGGGTHKLTAGLAETVLNYKLLNFEEDPDVRRRLQVAQLKDTATPAPAAA